METIRNYIDNMFASLPKTTEMKQLRDEILANMEDKYHELIHDGKSENEAIGIVIAEFGNIDEIVKSYDIPQGEKEESKQQLTEAEVNEYLQVNRLSAKWVGIGTLLCILGSALLVLCVAFADIGYIREGIALTTGLILFLVMVAIAVSLFIYAGMKLNKWKYVYQQIDLELPKELQNKIESRKHAEHPKYVTAIIVAVVLIILSPSSLFLTLALNENMITFGVVIMLAVVATAIYLLIYFGTTHSAYTKLLEIPYEREIAAQEEKFHNAIGSIIMPLAVIIFLVTGIVYGMWHINWLVFPIAALLIAVFGGTYSLFSKKSS